MLLRWGLRKKDGPLEGGPGWRKYVDYGSEPRALVMKALSAGYLPILLARALAGSLV
jgi:hypothetical protein